MIKTEFFNDFLVYYDKAMYLQQVNLKQREFGNGTQDPIMDNITIYDVVNRRYAGFSKVLEDITGRRKTGLVRYKKYVDDLKLEEFLLVCLFHRFTGSGASFMPTILPDGTRNPKEHGYYNNHVDRICETLVMFGMEGAIKYIVECKEPMVTSIGNQPPSLKNGDPSKYRLAMQYYFDNYAVEFINNLSNFLRYRLSEGSIVEIKEGVDWCCNWHKSRGFKQWHFVLTAFIMDIAEYLPHLVDRDSHCYYGANCIKAFKMMFIKEKSDKMKNDEFYEKCMTELCRERPTSKPYDMEDVCCDVIRYWTEYIPKGYEALSPEQTVNNSTLKVDGVYSESAKNRIDLILGTKY